MIKKSSRSGFSFIELMVVIAIIGILSVIGLAGYNNAMRKARDSRRKSDIQAIAQALTLYRMDHGRYPSYENYKKGDEVPVDPATNTYPFGKYIKREQLFDPATADFQFTGPKMVPYSYVCVGQDGTRGCRQFVVCARMEAVGGGNFQLNSSIASATGASKILNQTFGSLTGINDIGGVGTIVARSTSNPSAGTNLGEWYCATSQ